MATIFKRWLRRFNSPANIPHLQQDNPETASPTSRPQPHSNSPSSSQYTQPGTSDLPSRSFIKVAEDSASISSTFTYNQDGELIAAMHMPSHPLRQLATADLNRNAQVPSKLTLSVGQPVPSATDGDVCVSATDSAFGVEDIRQDFLTILPLEIALQILSWTDSIATLRIVARVSRRWCELVSDNEVWRVLYTRRWGAVHPSKYPIIVRAEAASRARALAESSQPSSPIASISQPSSPMSQDTSSPRPISLVPTTADHSSDSDATSDFHSLATPSSTSHSTHLSPVPNFRYLYRQRLLLNRNWAEGNIEAKYIHGHEDSVYCIQFDPVRLLSGSRDRTVRYWDLKTLECTRVLTGHNGSVLCLQYDSRYVVTGSSDATMIVWNFDTGAPIRTLRGHASPVLDVRFNAAIVVSCSKDWTIRVWDLELGAPLRSLEGHRAAVNAVHLWGPYVASASGDNCVKLWNVETGTHVRDFRGHDRGLACVQFDGEYIVSGSNDRTIKVWDAGSGECVLTLPGGVSAGPSLGHTDLVRTLCFDRERIVSGSYDQTIKVWDFRTGELMLNLERAHTSWVFHVQTDATKIISASQDRKIVIWDFTKGLDDPAMFD